MFVQEITDLGYRGGSPIASGPRIFELIAQNFG